MNVGPTNSETAAAFRAGAALLTSEIAEYARSLAKKRKTLQAIRKALADLAVTERRDKLHALLVSKYPDGVRVDSDELLDDFRALAGLRVGSHDTLRQDLLTMVRDGRAWRKAIPASPKPGRVFVYGPLIAK